MKNTVTYAVVFFIAFAFVSLAMYLSSKAFNNIFMLDFSSPVYVGEKVETGSIDYAVYYPTLEEAKVLVKEEIISEIVFALNERDSNQINTLTEVFQNKIAILEETLNDQLTAKKTLINEKEETIQQLQTENETGDEEAYNTWLKSTVKMYEAMDSKKAAKIIQKYSDNVARDIIYTMNRKKAAQIMSELNPETVIKLTRAK